MWIGDWLLTPQRVAVHGPTATAVLADVHLGYAAARQRRGDAIPRMTVEEELRPLANVVARQQVQRLVVAGDLFEEGCRAELLEELLAWLEGIGLQLELVPGNHDVKHKSILTMVNQHRFRLAADLQIEGWRVLHGDLDLPNGPALHGHIHPAVRYRGWMWPCYLRSSARFVLPAYSAEAAGVNVLRQPLWRGYHCWAISGEHVRDLGVLR